MVAVPSMLIPVANADLVEYGNTLLLTFPSSIVRNWTITGLVKSASSAEKYKSKLVAKHSEKISMPCDTASVVCASHDLSNGRVAKPSVST